MLGLGGAVRRAKKKHTYPQKRRRKIVGHKRAYSRWRRSANGRGAWRTAALVGIILIEGCVGYEKTQNPSSVA